MVVLVLTSGCGFGVGAFRGRDRSAAFRTADQTGVADGYERVSTESWTDVGADFGVSIGLKPAITFAAPPGGGDVGVGYGFDVHLNLRWRMLELTSGYAMERADFDEGASRVERNGLVIGLNYYFMLADVLLPYVGAAFQFGDVCFGADGCEGSRVEDVVGGRGTVGLAVIVPELLFDQDMMFRLEGRFIGTPSVTVAGRQGPFLGGAIGLEALMFF